MSRNQKLVLVATMLVTFVLGSIHSFSVFLVPMETKLTTGRAQISLLYSFSLIFLTLSVLGGYRIYDRLSAARMVLLSCLVAATGLFVSAYSNTWFFLFLGYSVLFGTANGVGYGFVLQLAGRLISQQKAFAMASVTASYAVGSVVFSFVLSTLVQQSGLTVAFLSLGGVLICCGMLSAWILSTVNAGYSIENSSSVSSRAAASSPLYLWWLAYGCSVFAGLMAIGHAAGIVQTLGGSYSDSVWGAVWVGCGSSAGGFVIGAVVSRRSVGRYLLGLPLLAAVAMLVLVIAPPFKLAISLLTLVGFSYGALIALYPYAISEHFGDQDGPRVYGRVFTAWGFAGLAGPWSAGKIYDLSASYSQALVIAAIVALASGLFFWCLQKNTNKNLNRSAS